jgi:hypothetical protein
MRSEPGDVRFGADDRLEVFDGVRWRPLMRLPDLPAGAGALNGVDRKRTGG